jgi:hypothetical protein
MSNVVAMTHSEMTRMQASARVHQARYDTALSPWDQQAPAPVLGESVDTYRRKTLGKMQCLLPDDHELKRIPIHKLAHDTLDAFDPQFCAATKAEAYNPKSVPWDAPLRRVPQVDSNGLKTVVFIGQRSFIHDHARPGRIGRIRNPSRDPGWFVGR